MNEKLEYWTSLPDFLDYLELPSPPETGQSNPFPFLVSAHFASKIGKGDPKDPLLREVLPTETELREAEGFCDDPVGDQDAEQEKGILQKYQGRALVIATQACSLHCRFCFRRNHPCASNPGITEDLDRWLGTHPDIREVILSGGDPLLLDGPAFENLLEAILRHNSVSTLRIHSRVPVTLPQRLNPDGTHFQALRNAAARRHLVFVNHVDHANELDGASNAVFKNLRDISVTLLNQSVLLRGVNDSADTLARLSEALFEQGVLPYYLHQLDHARGVAHFEISDTIALGLLEELRNRLPGYLVPRLVRELPGEKSKRPLL